MMTEYLNFLFYLSVPATVTWFLARRKNNADAKSGELDNVEKAITIWRNLTEAQEARFNHQIEELRQENGDLEKRIDQVTKENESLKKQMKGLELENKKLQAQLKIFNKNNPPLEATNEPDQQ